MQISHEDSHKKEYMNKYELQMLCISSTGSIVWLSAQ